MEHTQRILRPVYNRCCTNHSNSQDKADIENILSLISVIFLVNKNVSICITMRMAK